MNSKICHLIIIIVLLPSFLFASRVVIDFNKDWKFLQVDNPEFAEIEVSEMGWSVVNVPHDWAFEEGISKDAAQGEMGGYHGGGVAWYRKTFTNQPQWKDMAVYIDFDGVYMNSEVWINGHFLGKRPYGYISFRYEISSF